MQINLAQKVLKWLTPEKVKKEEATTPAAPAFITDESVVIEAADLARLTDRTEHYGFRIISYTQGGFKKKKTAEMEVILEFDTQHFQQILVEGKKARLTEFGIDQPVKKWAKYLITVPNTQGPPLILCIEAIADTGKKTYFTLIDNRRMLE